MGETVGRWWGEVDRMVVEWWGKGWGRGGWGGVKEEEGDDADVRV